VNDHDSASQEVFELLDSPFDEALLLLGFIECGVLAKVAVFFGVSDHGRDLRAPHIDQLFKFAFESRKALGGDFYALPHIHGANLSQGTLHRAGAGGTTGKSFATRSAHLAEGCGKTGDIKRYALCIRFRETIEAQ
jgi:hypothetical protein